MFSSILRLILLYPNKHAKTVIKDCLLSLNESVPLVFLGEMLILRDIVDCLSAFNDISNYSSTEWIVSSNIDCVTLSNCII